MEQVLSAIMQYLAALYPRAIEAFAEFVEGESNFRQLKNAAGVGNGPSGMTPDEEKRFNILDDLTVAIENLPADDRAALAAELRKSLAESNQTDDDQTPTEEPDIEDSTEAEDEADNVHPIGGTAPSDDEVDEASTATG